MQLTSINRFPKQLQIFFPNIPPIFCWLDKQIIPHQTHGQNGIVVLLQSVIGIVKIVNIYSQSSPSNTFFFILSII